MSWPDLGSWTPRSPQKTHNRAGQVGMHGPKARPGARRVELPCAGMPAKARAGTVGWWWGGLRCTRRGGRGPVAGGVV
jgi:hypothetical protein